MTKRVVFCLFAIVVAGVIATVDIRGAQAQPSDLPNIVLINLDDADIDLLDDEPLARYFPNIKRLIADEGTRFSNFHVVAPLCGPSRGSLFRGQYPHNTGIVRNQLGWEIFYDGGYTDAEMGMWMREAGYETALVGKYCHEEYPNASKDDGYVPPGWDRFHASLGGKYFETPRNLDGRRVTTSATTYRTDAERASATKMIESHNRSKPLFLYVAPFAPHGTTDPRGMIAPRFQQSFTDAIVPRTPDFDELDVSDKTPQYQALPRLGAEAGPAYDFRYQNRIRAMLAVDQMVGELFAELEDRDMLDNTYVMLTSDNGFQLGHHRDLFKKDPFDRVTRVQLLVRGPGIPAGQTDEHLLAHIDLVPTLLELGGAEAPAFVDGKSFAPLLTNAANVEPEDWRDAILIENQQGKTVNGVDLDVHYVALRRFDDVYVEWANGDREYYDLATDPYQLENSWRSLSGAERSELANQLQRLRNCAGPVCNGGSAVPRVDTSTFTGDDRLLPMDLRLGGTATADLGTKRVEVVVRHVKDRTYWNGQRFQDEYVAVDANVISPAAGQTQWTLPVQLREGNEYWVSARTEDMQGNVDPIAATGFFTAARDNEAPTVHNSAITRTADASLIISGRAADDRAVSQVRLRVVDTNGQFWNGDRFVPNETVILARLVTQFGFNSSWTTNPLSLPPGDYLIEAFAVDAAGRTSGFDTLQTTVVATCNDVVATITGTIGDDVIVGTDGDDVIHGLTGDDQIDGGDGNDVICGGAGADVITGGNGRDTIFGNAGADTIDGDAGQ